MSALGSELEGGEQLVVRMEVLDVPAGGAAEASGVKFLGSVPLDPTASRCSERGKSLADCDSSKCASEAFDSSAAEIKKSLMCQL